MAAYHIFVEMPSGMQSRGYHFTDKEKADKAFMSIGNQLLKFNLQDELFSADAIMHNEIEEEINRFHVARLERP